MRFQNKSKLWILPVALLLLGLVVITFVSSRGGLSRQDLGFIDKSGRLVIDLNRYNGYNGTIWQLFEKPAKPGKILTSVGSFSCGRAAISLASPQQSYYLSEQGKLLPLDVGKVSTADTYSEGLAVFRNHDEKFTAQLCGYIDLTGNIVIPPKYTVTGGLKIADSGDC